MMENRLSNGDHCKPSLPPEPLGSPQPIINLSLTMITVNAQLVALKIAQKKLDLAIAASAIERKVTLTANLARNPPAIASFSPTLSPNPSNYISANLPHAETFILPAVTSPSIPPPPPNTCRLPMPL